MTAERASASASMQAIALISSGELSMEWAMRYLFPETARDMYGLEGQWAGSPHANSDGIAPGTTVHTLKGEL